MKKFFKFLFIAIGLLVVLGIIGAIAGGNSGSDNSTVEKSTPTKQVDNSGNKITSANYNKIKAGDSFSGKGGMTEDQVFAILGKPDTSTKSESNGLKMNMCYWSAGAFSTKGISVTFINGHVSDKSWSE